MDFFKELEKKQSSTPFSRSGAMNYFLRNSGILADIPPYSIFSKATKPFDIIRANILIAALSNKECIETMFMERLKEDRKLGVESSQESIVSDVKKKMLDLPYFQDGNTKIFVPVFPRSINKIYSDNFFSFQDRNFKKLLTHFEALLIDPFDTYGPELYNSFFTKLVKVKTVKGEVAYYNYDSYEIYIVNEEGRLEVSIPLFDRGLHRKNTNHMLERIEPVLNAYFENNKEEFVKRLVDNKLISSSFVYKNKHDEHKFFRKIDKGI